MNRKDNQRARRTIHSNSLIKSNHLSRQTALLQIWRPKDIHLKCLRAQYRHGEIGNRIQIIQAKCSIDIDNSAIVCLDLWHYEGRYGCCCADQRNCGIESVDGWVVSSLVTQDLRLVDVDRVGGWVGEGQIRDV